MDDNPLPEQKTLSPVVIFAAASALGAMLIIVWVHHFGLLKGIQPQRAVTSLVRPAVHTPLAPPRNPVTADQLAPVVPALPANLPPPQASFAAMIAQGVAELGLKPKTVTLPNELALQEVADIKRADYAAASRLAADVLGHSRLDGWQFAPFNVFMASLTHGNDPSLLNGLNEWVRQEPQSALAYLVRGVYYAETGSNLRGPDGRSMIPPEILAMYAENQRRAEADLQQSISLNPHIPWSYYELLHVIARDGNESPGEEVFQQAIKAYPGYYALYERRLHMLEPQWGGSLEDLYAFAAQYAGKAPDSSPLQFLYLNVYYQAMNDTWYDCDSAQDDAKQQCFDDTLKKQRIPKEVRAGVVKALNLYKVSDPIHFSEAAWSILGMMATSPGSKTSDFGEILQTAANIMGSDTRLTHVSGHNSYMLDDVTAQVWEKAGYLENADQKFRDALVDIDQTKFHDEAERDLAAKTVLTHLMSLYRANSQWLNTIIFYDAAESVGGVNFTREPHPKCIALFKLKHYAEAVTECTRVLQANNYFTGAQFYLGRSYEGLQQWDTALSVLEPVALGADNSFRVGAAIWMSVDYGKKKDFVGELQSLNEHGYLFDTDMQGPDDLAASFNNRCHALMELGRLQEALDDCNVSLKYGQLPDTIRKHQELVRMLADKRQT
jgi:tetratricopeptide (TPR) repeat protein